MRSDRIESIGGGVRGAGRGRVGSSTYGNSNFRPLSAKAKKTIKAKEELPLQRVTRALEGDSAKGWKPTPKSVTKAVAKQREPKLAKIKNDKIVMSRSVRIKGKAKDINQNAWKTSLKVYNNTSSRVANKVNVELRDERNHARMERSGQRTTSPSVVRSKGDYLNPRVTPRVPVKKSGKK